MRRVGQPPRRTRLASRARARRREREHRGRRGRARRRAPPGAVARHARVVAPADDLAAIREHTRAPIVLVASGEASQLLDEALEADVADVLLLPQLADNVVFAIRKAAHAARRTDGVRGRNGTVITVFSPKGGTGKTVVATNLAAALAKNEGKKTLLLDLDLQFGDAAIMLGVEPEKTIFDLVVAPGELDSEKLAGYVTHHPCGLDDPRRRRCARRTPSS